MHVYRGVSFRTYPKKYCLFGAVFYAAGACSDGVGEPPTGCAGVGERRDVARLRCVLYIHPEDDQACNGP